MQHGLQSSSSTGHLRVVVRAVERWLEMSVTDDGKGIPSNKVEEIFFAESPKAHVLMLLRRRLQGLFGHRFSIEASSDLSEGTIVTVRIPLQMPFELVSRSLETVRPDTSQLAAG